MATIPSQRHLFDIPDDVAYFNCASNSPQLKASTDRLVSGARAKSRPWERTPGSYFEDAETIRALASELFGGDRDGYAVVPAASYGLSAAARAIEPQLGPGDAVLVIAEEFPSNVFAWRRTVRETGAMLVTVPLREDGHWTRSVLDRIDRSVKVVSISTCHWTNGRSSTSCPSRTPAATWVAFSSSTPRSRSARCRLRWRMSSPTSSWLPATSGCCSRTVSASSTRPRDGAMPARSRRRGRPARMRGTSPGWSSTRTCTCPARCPHIVGASLPDGDTARMLGELKARNVYISQRGRSLRFAPHLHVGDADIERLQAALDETVTPP